jgi:hypothetical protein
MDTLSPLSRNDATSPTPPSTTTTPSIEDKSPSSPIPSAPLGEMDGVLSDVVVPTTGEELASVGVAILVTVRSLFNNDWYIRASSLFNRLEVAITAVLSSSQTTISGDVRDKLKAIQAAMRRPEYRMVSNVRNELQTVLDNIGSTSGWEDGGEKSGIRTYYRAVPNSSTHTFYTVGDVDAPLFDILSCMYEVDLLHTWLTALSGNSFIRSLVIIALLLNNHLVYVG